MNPSKLALFCLPALFFFSSCGDSEETPRLARETRASDPKAQALFNEARAAEKAGKTKRATKLYRTLGIKYPLFLSAHEAAYRRAKLLERAGEPLEAFEAYNDILTKYPASPHYAEAMNRQQAIALDTANGNITESFVWVKTRVGLKDTAAMLTQVRENAPRAPSAELAQFTLGRLYQKEGGDRNAIKAIAAFRELTRDYPNSRYAAPAQYQIGKILLSSARKGNQDTANLDRARQAFEDLLIAYPDSKEAPLAKGELTKLKGGETKRLFEVAEFYRKKGNVSSAIFYYQETLNRSRSGSLHDQAQSWINKLSRP